MASPLAAVAQGFVEVGDNETTIIAHTCEWADEIDLNRAEQAKQRAQAQLQAKTEQKEFEHAQIKFKKAINRIRSAQK